MSDELIHEMKTQIALQEQWIVDHEKTCVIRQEKIEGKLDRVWAAVESFNKWRVKALLLISGLLGTGLLGTILYIWETRPPVG